MRARGGNKVICDLVHHKNTTVYTSLAAISDAGCVILGPVVLCIVSLTSSLRGQLVNDFISKNCKSFSHFFNKKY